MLPADLKDRLVESLEAHERKTSRGLEAGAVFDPRAATDASIEGTVSVYLREALKIPFERVLVKSVTPATGWDVTNSREVVYVTADGQERALSRSTFTSCFSVVVPTRYDRILEDEGDP